MGGKNYLYENYVAFILISKYVRLLLCAHLELGVRETGNRSEEPTEKVLIQPGEEGLAGGSV